MNALKSALAILLFASVAACQTVSTEQACRSRAAAEGARLDGPAMVQPIPNTEQILYEWEANEDGRPGATCTTQRGHVQDLKVFRWEIRPADTPAAGG